MSIDGSIPLSAVSHVTVDPFAVAQSLQSMQIQRQNADTLREQREAQAAARREETAKTQREAARQALGDQAVSELFQSYEPGKPIPTKTLGQLYQGYGAERASAVVKGLIDFSNADLTSADNLRKSMLTRIAGLRALPESMRPAAYDAVVKDYAGKGVLRPEEIAPYSPDVLDQYEQQLMTPEQRAALPGVRASNTKAAADAAVAQQVAAGTKNGLTPEQQAADARAKATAAEVARHDRAGEAIQAQTRDLERDKFNATYGQGKDENGQPVASPLAKAIAEYRQPGFSGRAAESGPGQAVMAQVMALNPSYDASQFPTRQKMRMAFTSGNQGQQASALNTAIMHTENLVEAADAMQNGSFRPGNAAYNAIRSAFGDSAVTNFEFTRDIMAGELATAMKKSGATDTEIDKVSKALKASGSPTQLRDAATKVALPMIAGKAKTLDEQYHGVMGEKDPFSIYTPSAKAVMEKYGAQSAAQVPATVKMRAPNGQVKDVAADQVAHYQQLGATVIK